MRRLVGLSANDEEATDDEGIVDESREVALVDEDVVLVAPDDEAPSVGAASLQ